MERVSLKPALPVDAVLPEILSSLRQTPNLVIEAPPGAGKTTRVPPAILGLVRGEVIVLEPRRIAARMSARRVAWELGEEVGGTVGYQVRFEEKTGPATRLRFVTEGILTRGLISDPTLKGVDAVILDEFHERHLDSDLALALLKRLQQTRPTLRIIVMSATLDAAPIARFLNDCPVVRSEGRMFPLTVRYTPYSSEPLPIRMRKAVEVLMKQQHSGSILAFLPGIAEIRQSMRECEAVARQSGLIMLPLHGDLSPAEQDRAVLPSPERRLILATNVAESSVTVEGVTAVIDSGLARHATYSPWTGLPTLHVGRISKASATQRAGRAGRTGPGEVMRLYPEEDYLLRPEHDTPEILRSDLSQLLLTLRAMKITHLTDLDWIDLPPAEAIQSAESLLDQIGATGDMAQRMTRYPLTPRLSRIVIEALDRGVGEDGCRVAAMLSLGERSEKNDLLEAMDQPQSPRERQHTEQLLRMARPTGKAHHDDNALLLSVLAGFPDRVGRRRLGSQVLLSTGISAEVAGGVPAYEFLIAIDAEDRKENASPLVRMTARIEPEWLLDLFPGGVKESSTVVWNRGSERVEQVNALLYGKLVLEESRGPAPDADAADLLAQKALEAGIEKFVDREMLDSHLARLSFAGFDTPDLHETLRDLCLGLRSFAELKEASKDFFYLMEQQYDSRLLNEVAPLSVSLKSGRPAKIHYEQGRPPWISSRLQDFFGMKETPRIGQDRSPLVVHLLAPNHRAVQTTTDLAGFWERLYPQVRKELMRRYPRHAWPERP
ncbi:ATP-dependent helicase HrpB [Granulicella aggregans]|uniref:ATP-dependent helicase HrpB n=1 Tax=Granulicella aggregans TaxID=474949 RepID=A0A7W8E4P7_9BACT|nr:ATP-dependent helicase HrpB [Granulicella aggregans]MBB5058756.1 ATP-dependent helicase HrpB [Granulicella aggregans]